MAPPQAFVSEFAPRLRGHLNSLLTPVVPGSTAVNAPASRTTKRGTVVINYSEDLLAEDDDEEPVSSRRNTGLRTKPVDQAAPRETLIEKLSTELTAPVEVQGVWREWMGKTRQGRTDKQIHAQAALPLTLIPIRIDLEIPSFIPAAALPLPADAASFGVNPALPAYRASEPTPAYRLRDYFLWNLHEHLITPDQFALQLTNELDLPNANYYAEKISRQIRDHLEEYAGIALHPLFRPLKPTSQQLIEPTQPSTPAQQTSYASRTPARTSANTPAPDPRAQTVNGEPSITAVAQSIANTSDSFHNPDDTYRCIILLNVNILNKLYTDRFEWSLLHPPGVAEMFARQTCADLGLAGEWVPAMAHAIYEAVLKLRKEACEAGTLPGAGPIENLTVYGGEAGWRYDDNSQIDDWEPKLEILSKDEIERREDTREREIRRMRRETAKITTTFDASHVTANSARAGGYFDNAGDGAETPMGRGERSKRKRRFRSLSPANKVSTPNEPAGYGGGAALSDWERQTWRCSHCQVYGTAVWGVRDGPAGPRTLCSNCGLLYEHDKRLPPWCKGLHALDPRPPGLVTAR